LPDLWPSGKFQPHATIVAGVQAAVLQLPSEAALTAHYYQTVAATISAGVKLLRLGQIGAQRLLTESLTRAPSLIQRSLDLPEQDIGCFQPLLDIASARHERAYSRVFIS
jgi:urease accessory protein